MRRRSCPSSSEVLIVAVRRRACPSFSKVVDVDVREKALSLSLRGTNRQCEEEGRGANPSSSEVPGDEQDGHLENVRKRVVCSPSSSKVPAAADDEAVGLGGGEPVSPPQWDAQPTNAQPNTTRCTKPTRSVDSAKKDEMTKSGLRVRPTKK